MSIFSNFLAKVSSTKTAFVSGDAANAAAGSMLYVAKSGGIDDAEFDMLVDMMKSNPRFAGMDIDSIVGKWEAYVSERMMKRDLINLLRNVRVVKEQSEDVLISAIEVADAQDGIDDDEIARLNEIADALGLSLKDYM